MKATHRSGEPSSSGSVSTIPEPVVPGRSRPGAAQGVRTAERDRLGLPAAADAAVLALLALGLRLIQLGHTPQLDEFNHIFAARSLLEDGTLSINGGAPYDRAWLFTYMVAAAFRLFGESLVAARLPALLAGAAMVPLLYLWVRAMAGRGAAWVAALLLCLHPEAIYVSQLTRFYSLQALLFLGGAIAVYRLTAPPRPAPGRIVALGAAAALCLALALHFQVTTVVGIAALAGWALMATPSGPLPWIARQPRRGWILAGALAVAAAAGFVALRAGLADRYLRLFRYADLWAQATASQPMFYHDQMLEEFPTLWTLFPLAVLLAATRRTRIALFLAWVFALPFAVHSFAAWKNARYIIYVMPFFFALSGIAVAALVPRLRATAAGFVGRARPTLAPPIRAAAGDAIVVAALLFTVVGNGAFIYTYRMLTVDDAAWKMSKLYRGEPDWAAAAERLRPIAGQADVVLSSADLKSLYYLDRLDYTLSATEIITQTGTSNEFAVSRKMTVPMVSTAESVRRIVECHPTGLVVVERKHWRNSWSVPPATADFLAERAEMIPLPNAWRLVALRWETTDPAPAAECAALRTQDGR